MKRLAVFSVNSEILSQSKYVIYLLQEIKRCCDKVVVCISSNAEKAFLQEIHQYAKEVYMYDTYIDINRWKDVLINKIPFKKLEELEEIVFLNDSVFGPLYPFREVFEKMEQRKLDFWGISVHGKMKKRYPSATEESWPRFIQTYFWAIRKEMFCNQAFLDFFITLPDFENYEEASEKFEFIFTETFERLGFKWEVLVDTREDENKDEKYFMSFILFDLYELVSKRKYPFIPKIAFEIDSTIMRNYHNGDDLYRTLKYISSNTNYNLDYIYESIIPKLNLQDLISRLNLNYVFSDCSNIEISQKKYAVFAYLYYEDLFEYSISKIMNVPEYFDIYIATDTKEKSRKIWEGIEPKRKNNVRLCRTNGRGRDLAALLIEFRPYVLNYEVICFVHDKKSSQMDYVTVGKCFNENLWENVLFGKNYIKQILKLFQDNKYLGFLTPPMIYHNLYYHTAIDAWTICFEKTQELAEKLGVEIHILKEKNPVSLGSTFWCRPLALKKLFDYDFQYEEFPKEPMDVDGTISHAIERIFPYIAQEAGFYTGIVMNEEAAAIHYNNYRETIALLMRELNHFAGVDAATVQTTIMSLQNLPVKKKKEFDVIEKSEYKKTSWYKRLQKKRKENK